MQKRRYSEEMFWVIIYSWHEMIDFQLMSTKTKIGTKFGDPPPSNDCYEFHVNVELDISKVTVF